jgi:hypothetical protein
MTSSTFTRGVPSAGRVAGCLRVAKLSGESLVGLVDDRTGCGELLVAFQGQSEEVPAAVVGVALAGDQAQC